MSASSSGCSSLSKNEPDPPVTITDPTSPYSFDISPKPGRLFTVNGLVTSDRFSLNLCAREDIGLHLDCRMKENEIVRNSRIYGKWDYEERTHPQPLTRGERFEIMILVERCRCMIAFNGHHVAEFAHRFPLSIIDKFAVHGDVNISLYRETNVESGGPSHLNFPLPSVLQPRYVTEDHSRVYDIPNSFKPGRILHIMGRTKFGTFCCNVIPSVDSKDIGLHISCRLGLFQEYIALNSMDKGKWEDEVRPDNFKLGKYQNFLLEIQSHVSEYKLIINGVSLATFPVRNTAPESLYVLSVTGAIDHRYVALT